MFNIPPAWNKLARLSAHAQKKNDKAKAAARYHHAHEQDAVKQAEKGGYFKPLDTDDLTRRFCEEKSKFWQNIHYIQHITIPSHRLRDISPLCFASRLRIIDLSSNYITKIDALGPCRQLVKLDVHSNQIANIPNHHFWSGMKSLRIVHLHDNPLSKLETLHHLSNCRRLQILTVYDTPLYLRKNYRHHAVNTIFTLLALDYHLVADEEIIEDADFGGKFQALSPSMFLDSTLSYTRDRPFAEEWRDLRTLILSVNSRLAHNSPVLIIQRYFRGLATRKRYHFILETKQWAATTIQRWWRHKKGKTELITAPPPSRDTFVSPSGDTVTSRNTGQSRDAGQSRDTEKQDDKPVIAEIRPPTTKPQSRNQTPKPKITINLTKLNDSVIQPLSLHQDAIDNELLTYRTEPVQNAVLTLASQSRDTRRQVVQPPPAGSRHHTATTMKFPYINPYGSLEVAEELGELPRVHFRLSGIKTDILEVDLQACLLFNNLISGQQVRDADTHYHRQDLYSAKPKVAKHNRINDDQRHFSRVQATMSLSCLKAVEKAYKERDRAETTLAQMDKIMTMREERGAAKRRVNAAKTERRQQIILDRQKDKIHALEALEQQQIHSLHYIYKSQELRQRAQNFRHTVFKEKTFVTDFSGQQTSISNALLRHDRQSRQETRQKSLVDFVSKHREDELEQQEMIKKYLQERKSLRQADMTLANATLDSQLLQDSSDRLAHAHARVDQLRVLRKTARDFCVLPEQNVKHLPDDDRSLQVITRGLDRWNTTVTSYSGHVGKHHIAVNAAAS